MNNTDNRTKGERTTDLSFYQADNLAFWGVMFATIVEVFYLVSLLNISELTIIIGAIILLNIVILLLLFTCALQLKVYMKNSVYMTLVIGVYSLLRIILVPIFVDVTGSLLVSHISNAIMGVVLLVVALQSYIKITKQENYIKAGKISFIQRSK